jgi:predicted HicB family RNase H-like nuclease
MRMEKYVCRRAYRDLSRKIKQRLNLCLHPNAIREFDNAAWEAGISLSKWLEQAGHRYLTQKSESLE